MDAAWSADLIRARFFLSRRLGGIDCAQGFQNDSTGRLLCPAHLDWSTDEFVDRLTFERRSNKFHRVKAMLASTIQTVTADLWPAVFYQNMQVDAKRPWEGFLRNRLLIMVRLISWYWPAAANAMDLGMQGCVQGKNGCQGLIPRADYKRDRVLFHLGSSGR